jgi:hypothetical protein
MKQEQLDNYIQAGKGPKEREFRRLTGKSMRIGRRLNQEFAGLTREQMAERLIEKYVQLRGNDTSEGGEQQFVLHSFTLRPGRTAHFELPADLTPQEAEKLTKFIQILPSNPA